MPTLPGSTGSNGLLGASQRVVNAKRHGFTHHLPMPIGEVPIPTADALSVQSTGLRSCGPQQHDALGRNRFLPPDRAHPFARLGLDSRPRRPEPSPAVLAIRCGSVACRRSAWAAGRRRCSRDSRHDNRLAAPVGMPVGAFRRITAPVLGDPCRETARRCRPAATAPSKASVTACSSTSASLWPSRWRRARDLDAAQPQRAAGGQAMRVMSDADSQIVRGCCQVRSRE